MKPSNHAFWQFFVSWLLLCILLLAVSCRTSSSTQERVAEFGNTYHAAVFFSRDSVFLHDSVFVAQRHDTIFEYRYRYRDRILQELRTDTIRDTIATEVCRVQKEVVARYRTPRVVLWLLFLFGLCSICSLFWWICRRKP